MISLQDPNQSIIHMMMSTDDMIPEAQFSIFLSQRMTSDFDLILIELYDYGSIGKVRDALFRAKGSARCHLKQLRT